MKRALILPLLAALAFAGPAHAEDYAVSAIKYKNKGAYKAYFNIRVKYSNGNVIECEGKNTTGQGIQSGKSITIQLDNSDHSLDSDIYDVCTPKVGNEVWGMVYIDRGLGYSPASNRESCKKDKTKFYYHPDGGTLVVHTEGTTENGNRCRIDKKGGVKYPVD